MSRTLSHYRLESLESRRLLSAPAIAYAGPLIITAGGTYSGAWQSTDANTPVIRVRTSQPVIIENSVLKGKGELIVSNADHTNITVRNTKGYALNPNVAGNTPGRFFDVQKFDKVDLENNYLEGTSGIVMRYFWGDKSASTTIKILKNFALNIDGRKSDGNGGFMNFNKRTSKIDGHSEEGFSRVQFFQMGMCTGVANVDIGWNQVVNLPGQSRVEDNISVYRSSGTSSSTIKIHDNYIQGAYTIKPNQGNTSDSNWNYSWGFSGGGIMLGDGGTSNLADACGWVKAYNNQVIDTTNYGITVTAGHDTSYYNNRIISAGILSDGSAITAQNVGACIWDASGNRNLSTPTWYNVTARDNLIGWAFKDGHRNDWWIPHTSSWTNNTRWSGTITLATQNAEMTVWKSKLTAGGVKVGAT